MSRAHVDLAKSSSIATEKSEANDVTWVIVKYAITAALVVMISEVAKRSDKLGGLIAALPMVTILTLIWLYIEKQPSEKIAAHAYYTFWYVIPTMPMFLVFPSLLAKWGFWPSLGLSAILTMLCFAITAFLLKTFLQISLI